MSTVCAAQLAAYKLLRGELYRHLDEAEFHALKWADWEETDIETARALIPELVDMIRAVLMAHAEDDDAECELCASQWPCPSVQTIHAIVTDPQRQFVKLLGEDT